MSGGEGVDGGFAVRHVALGHRSRSTIERERERERIAERPKNKD